MNPLFADPLFIATAVAAVMIIGIAKGGFAGGPVLMAVPLMSLSIDPLRAAAILLPILLLMDALAVHKWWRKWNMHELEVLVPGAVIGTLLGWATFRFFSADGLRVLVGALALGYALLWFFTQNKDPRPRSPSKARGVFWGSAAGFTSFAVHAGSPPLHIYLLGQKPDKASFQATTVAFFFVVNWLKLGPYALLGQLDTSNLGISLVLLPLAPLGIALGGWLHHRINEKNFFRFTYAALLVIGARLIYVGLS
ncbi:MAG: sulfite exporter TauE/SafE family protein [Gammaproteobacteria bacterium]|nr:sulfite exporter TauE/SafE family protein [Gammaproteobacteria bacterium]